MEFEFLNTPTWLLAMTYFLSLLAARECGRWLRRRQPPKEGDEEAFAMTSVLGLLALLIGFTFSIALQRHETRRELVVQEANALGTTWLRTDLLDGDRRDAVRATLRRYVDARVAYGMATSRAAEADAYAMTARLQAKLWSEVIAATAPFRDTARAASLVSTTNDAIDLAGARYANRESHVPPRILRTLWFVSLVAAGLVGFERGMQRTTTTLLFFLLALAVAVILDLDRPATGATRVSQQPMIDLKALMR